MSEDNIEINRKLLHQDLDIKEREHLNRMQRIYSKNQNSRSKE